MAEYQNGESRGKVVYNENIVQGIIAIAVSSVEGVSIKPNKKGSFKESIKIVNDKSGISVFVSVSVLYGYNIPDIAYNIQHGIRQNVENMTKYRISKIDVLINDVLFEESKQND